MKPRRAISFVSCAICAATRVGNVDVQQFLVLQTSHHSPDENRSVIVRAPVISLHASDGPMVYGSPVYSTGSQEESGSKRVMGTGGLPGTGEISFSKTTPS